MADTPKIRFKGFMVAWEQRKFEDIAFRVSTASDENSDLPRVEYEDIVAGLGILNKDLEEKESDKKGILFQEYDVLFGKLRPYLKNWLLPDFKGIAVGDFWVLRGLNASQKFIYTLIQGNQFQEIANQSSGTKMPRSDWKLVSQTEFPIPQNINEQEKIAQYFESIDHLITLHQRKCEETIELKKYVLRKMFPQNSQKIPEIRFAGFTEDWELCKFGDLADYKKGPFGSTLKKDIFVPRDETTVKVYEQQNAINKDWTLERYFITKEYAQKLSGFKVEGGDIIVSCAGTIGEIYELPMDAEFGIINQALMKIKVNESIVHKRMFMLLFTNMINDFTRVHSNGSAIKNIPPFSDLKPMEVLVPKMEEQKIISEHVTNLDHLITLHQNKCNELKEVKKFMLQNMFPQKG